MEIQKKLRKKGLQSENIINVFFILILLLLQYPHDLVNILSPSRFTSKRMQDSGFWKNRRADIPKIDSYCNRV